MTDTTTNEGPDGFGRNPATPVTAATQAAFAARLPFDDPADHDRVRRGLLAVHEGPIRNEDPAALQPVCFDPANWDFVTGDAPATVNSALWRQAKLNGVHGLFEVVDGVYQVRGYDTSCTTFVRGDEGWIVIDPLTTTETAATAKALVDEHLGVRPVNAVLYTHSHVDHYGGILGIVDRSRVDAGDCEVVAPIGFMKAAVAENVAAQAAMGRRALYQYGMTLPWDERGHVDQGLGKGVPTGHGSLVAPTIDIEGPVELVLDGVRIEFQLTPDSEAPAEMHFFFPDLKVMCMAENCTGTMHNVLTLRGALIRDALAWSKYIDESIVRFGDRLEVSIASHSWPHWGRDDVLHHLRNQRDLYRWIHDEAMRLANKGFTPDEISEAVELPPALWADWSCHGYYGTLSHNVRAVYQRYFGFYDGHPASLQPYPPVESAERYVEFMGGVDALLANARRSFDEGDYRWVAQVMRHAVFADPTNQEARRLQADAFEQLAYVSESGPWRDAYLTGASELRNGTPPFPNVIRPSIEVARGMTTEQCFDYLSVCLDGTACLDLAPFIARWVLTDTGDRAHVALSNGTLHARTGDLAPVDESVDVVVTTTRATLDSIVAIDFDLAPLVADGRVVIDGPSDSLLAVFANLQTFPMFFPIIEP